MKKILLLGTGGTIASEMSPDGLTPELSPQQLLRYVPAVSQLCEVECLSLFSIDSTCCAIATTITTVSSSPTAPTPWPIRPRR